MVSGKNAAQKSKVIGVQLTIKLIILLGLDIIIIRNKLCFAAFFATSAFLPVNETNNAL